MQRKSSTAAPERGGNHMDARLEALERRHLERRQDGDLSLDSDEGGDEDEDDEESSGPEDDRCARVCECTACVDQEPVTHHGLACPVSHSGGGGTLADGRPFTGLDAAPSSDTDDEGGADERAARDRARQALNATLRSSYSVGAAKGAALPANGTAAPSVPAADGAPPPGGMRVAASLKRPPLAAAPADAAAAAGPAAKRARKQPPRGPGAAPGGTGVGGIPGTGDPSSTPVAPRGVRLCDLGGIDSALAAIRELILCPLHHPELYAHLGVEPPRGVLLAGPPGCGKSSLAHAIAAEAGVPFFALAAPEIISGVSGESEAKLRGLFAAAAAAAPCIVFIDEIDAIAPKRDSAQREMERRIVAQLLACLDSLTPARKQLAGGDKLEGSSGAAPHATPHVAVLGATNRADALDSALRRAGRFDREIVLGVPDEAARCQILSTQSRGVRLAGDFDFERIARLTPGYVGADLRALTKEAAAIAVARIFESHLQVGPVMSALSMRSEPLTNEQMHDLAITMHDYEAALPRVQPSAVREGFATVPTVSWDDVGALDDVREELAFAITLPIAHPSAFAALGLGAATGVLLYGPPGCGKTLLARATASDARANFISVKGPELLNKFVGESERAVRTVFARAAAAAPCVLFFDELDSLTPRRGGDAASPAAERVVNQMLTEMDGLDPRTGVFVVGATNRPDMIDPAMLRPGRLDKLLFVPLPAAPGRAAILRALTRKTPLDDDVQVDALAEATDGFSGADLSSLVREASWAALRARYHAQGLTGGVAAAETAEQAMGGIHAAKALRVKHAHFVDALARVHPSVSVEDRRRYDRLRNRLQGVRGALPPLERAAPAMAGVEPQGAHDS